jgi:hypothetical protein
MKFLVRDKICPEGPKINVLASVYRGPWDMVASRFRDALENNSARTVAVEQHHVWRGVFPVQTSLTESLENLAL